MSTKFLLLENDGQKLFRSGKYNYNFDKNTGLFMRWGKDEKDDPDFSPFGPEIADIEISTICNGIPNEKGILTPCKFCYKGNSGVGKNMTIDQFKQVFSKFPSYEADEKTIYPLTQIAFGIGDVDSNPDLWAIMDHCRENGVIPNITVNGWNVNGQNAQNLVDRCGAIAVSRYKPVDSCYNAVETLSNLEKTDGGKISAVNIHMMLSEETYEDCLQVVEDSKTDPRLKNLNAIVFLALKCHGRGKNFTKLSSLSKYKKLVDMAFEKDVRIGFDSCSANSFLRSISGHERYDEIQQFVEPCESTLFSIYIDVDGKVYPCSFCPGENGWSDGISMFEVQDFVKEVWDGERVSCFRKNLVTNFDGSAERLVRCCPVYDLELSED